MIVFDPSVIVEIVNVCCRAWVKDTTTWDEREDRVFKNYTTKMSEKIKTIFHIKIIDRIEADIEQAVHQEALVHEKCFERIVSKLEEIMQYRFYVSVLSS